jgi:hypothetical protein
VTALAIVGIALFVVAVVVVSIGVVRQAVREFRSMRRLVRADAEEPELLPLPEPPPRGDVAPGWGFDSERG